MIIGSGLLAKAFTVRLPPKADWWIYAAGVSNSGCNDRDEFMREHARLSDAIRAGAHADAFVYFSTCSVMDPNARNSTYVRHKLDMERLTSGHPRFIVVSLPQIAGTTSNPHTLLNYLYARVSRSEKFVIWKNATRNIIDVDDVSSIVFQVLKDSRMRRLAINVANPISHPIAEIVAMMERTTGKAAITEEIDAGAAYAIDTSRIRPIAAKLGLSFDSAYVSRAMQKYYGP